MTALADIARAFDDVLRVRDVPDYPNALNGIQVSNRTEIRAIAAAVDLSTRTINAAIAAEANLLLVHHGLFWGGLQPIVGSFRDRIQLLIENDVAVYAAHLPLDVHATHGNNVLLARALELEPTGGFASYSGLSVGVRGEANMDTSALVARTRAFSNRHETELRTTPIPAGHRTRQWALCTGAGASADTLREAVETGVDTLIVGEGAHWTAVDAADHGLVILYAGHYATETLGVKSLANWGSSLFGIPWMFIDAPTGF
jgi:dinuclear metal center YbgI/SA1388 family protein